MGGGGGGGMGMVMPLGRDREIAQGLSRNMPERGERFDENKPRGSRTGGGASGCKIYVGNLSWDVKWQDLKGHYISMLSMMFTLMD